MSDIGDMGCSHFEVNAKGECICVDNGEPNPNYIAHWEPKLATMTRDEALEVLRLTEYHHTSNTQWLHDRILLVFAGVAPIDVYTLMTVNVLAGIFKCTRATDGIGTAVTCAVPFDMLCDTLREAFTAISEYTVADSANVSRGTESIDNPGN